MSRPWFKVSFFAQFPEGEEAKTYTAEESLAVAGKLAEVFGFEVIDHPEFIRLDDGLNRLGGES